MKMNTNIPDAVWGAKLERSGCESSHVAARATVHVVLPRHVIPLKAR